jgi:hypothetical protein
MVYADIEVELKEGYNRLILGGTFDGEWLNYDYIDVVSVDAQNPEEPEDPEDPDEPGTPDEPDQPDAPDTPDEPDQPDTPDQPDQPDTPNTPDQPHNPGHDTPAISHAVVTVVRAIVKTAVKIIGWIASIFRW